MVSLTWLQCPTAKEHVFRQLGSYLHSRSVLGATVILGEWSAAFCVYHTKLHYLCIVFYFFLSDVVRCLDGFTLGNVQLGHHVTVMLVVPMTFPLAPKHLIISLIPQIYLLYDQLLCYRTVDTLPARSRLLTVT